MAIMIMALIGEAHTTDMATEAGIMTISIEDMANIMVHEGITEVVNFAEADTMAEVDFMVADTGK